MSCYPVQVEHQQVHPAEPVRGQVQHVCALCADDHHGNGHVDGVVGCVQAAVGASEEFKNNL